MDFSFTNYPPLVTSSSNTSCTFLLNLVDPTINEEFSFKEGKKENLQAKLGFVPEGLIVVSAMCNQPLDHQLLAHILLELAEKFGEVMVDMHGGIENRRDLPGKVIKISSSENLFYNPVVVDVEFLKNWLKNPNFQMIK